MLLSASTSLLVFVKASTDRSSSFNYKKALHGLCGGKRSIPHSYNNYRLGEDTIVDAGGWLWNPSQNIDADGFLMDRYNCAIGAWESEMEIRGKYGSRSRHCQRFSSNPVIVRQVPGDGNCLFHSLAASLSVAETGKHMNFTFSFCDRSTSMRLRQRAIDVLSKRPLRKLFLQGDEYLQASDLVQTAASQYSITGDEYCRLMRKDGYWGGGPEIVAISNALRRPIHIYELAAATTVHELPYSNQGFWKKSKTKSFQLRRMACFGSPKFDFREPLHILSADSRFPDVPPGRHLSCGNHFLALFFPTPKMMRRERLKTKRKFASLRSGSTTTSSTAPQRNPTIIESYQNPQNYHHHSESEISESENVDFLDLFQKWIMLTASHIQKMSSSCQRSMASCFNVVLNQHFVKDLFN